MLFILPSKQFIENTFLHFNSADAHLQSSLVLLQRFYAQSLRFWHARAGLRPRRGIRPLCV